VERLAGDGVMAGVPFSRLDPAAGLDDVLLTCATEMTTARDIAALADTIRRESGK
jgi:glycine dehydrogenase subunit 1